MSTQPPVGHRRSCRLSSRRSSRGGREHVEDPALVQLIVTTNTLSPCHTPAGPGTPDGRPTVGSVRRSSVVIDTEVERPTTMMPSCSCSSCLCRNDPVAPPAIRQKQSCRFSPVIDSPPESRAVGLGELVVVEEVAVLACTFMTTAPIMSGNSSSLGCEVKRANDRLVSFLAPAVSWAPTTSPQTRGRPDPCSTGSCWPRGQTPLHHCRQLSVRCIAIRSPSVSTSQARWYIPTVSRPQPTGPLPRRSVKKAMS